MDSGVIPVRYAKALLKCSAGQGCEDQVYRDMQALADSYATHPGLRKAVDNPMAQPAQRQSLLEAACGGDPAPTTKAFITLVAGEGRVQHLQLMATAFLTLYRKGKNIVRGRLTTAAPVAPEVEAKMKKAVERRTGATVEFETQTDPSLIGGFILEYDTYRMDASVKAKLRRVAGELAK